VDGSATGTILNDDLPAALPIIRITDASATEGNSGSKQLTFTVSLDRAFGQTVSVDFTTRNQTAGEGDYVGKAGTLTFSPGQTSRTISVSIRSDTKLESDERFAIDLTHPVNATIGDALAIGTIRNDD
jgi:chitinase